MAEVTICSDFGAPKKSSLTLFLLFPHLFPMKWWNRMIFVFWMLSFKPHFSLSSFTFIRRLFSSSSLSAIRVISSAYLRLLIFFPQSLFQLVFPPVQHFSWFTLHILDKQGDHIQSWCTPFPNWNPSVVPCQVLTVASWPAYRFLKRQVRWAGILISFRIFRSLLWSSQSLWHSQWSRNRCFSGTLLLFPWSSGCWQFDLWFLCLF